MRLIFLLITIFPATGIASDQEFKLHLPCETGNICSNFKSDRGIVSLKKDPEMVLDKSNIISADIGTDEFDRPVLYLHMNQETAHKFSAMTERAIGNSIATVVGKRVVSQPRVMQKIESESFMLSSGPGKNPFWEDMPWIKSKAASKSK